MICSKRNLYDGVLNAARDAPDRVGPAAKRGGFLAASELVEQGGVVGVTTRKCSECPAQEGAPPARADAALSAS